MIQSLWRKWCGELCLGLWSGCFLGNSEWKGYKHRQNTTIIKINKHKTHTINRPQKQKIQLRATEVINSVAGLDNPTYSLLLI
jgi:hypothetical protein